MLGGSTLKAHYTPAHELSCQDSWPEHSLSLTAISLAHCERWLCYFSTHAALTRPPLHLLVGHCRAKYPLTLPLQQLPLYLQKGKSSTEKNEREISKWRELKCLYMVFTLMSWCYNLSWVTTVWACVSILLFIFVCKPMQEQSRPIPCCQL